MSSRRKYPSGAAKRKKYGYPKQRKKPRRWCFIDTEGALDVHGRYGIAGRQWCWTITAADSRGFERSLCKRRPLHTLELLAFICDLPAAVKLGAYGFGYDIDQITWALDENSLRRLHAGERVNWRGYALRKHANRLSVARITPAGERMRWRPVWDVVRFYRGRLLDVIDEWGVADDQERALVAAMKEQRGDFTLDYWRAHERELIAYSITENRLASRLQERFDGLARELGYPLSAWYGAGSMAAAMMNREGVRAHLDNRRPLTGKRFARALPWTYYGGRFEIARPGVFAPVYEYDLGSAYPAACLNLPCLEHSRWVLKDGVREVPGRWDLLPVAWHLNRASRWGPFPLRRRNGTVYYPLEGSSIVWGEEFEAACRCWNGITHQLPYWQHRQSCDCRPFEWVREVYRRRLELGRDTTGYPLKLGLNSVYGKLASTLGCEVRDGRPSGFTCPPWASMITAWTRARLLDALRSAGGPRTDAVAMFATDAIYTTRPCRGLELGDGLGQWTQQHFDSGLLVQPGIYFLDGAAKLKRRGRGLAQRDLERFRDSFYAAWERDGAHGEVEVLTEPRYQSVRLCLHRRRELAQAAWRWEPERRTIHFFPAGKRELTSAGWRPAVNEERRRGLFDGSPVHFPHSPFAVLLDAGLDGMPPAVPPEQIEAELLESDQPRVG